MRVGLEKAAMKLSAARWLCVAGLLLGGCAPLDRPESSTPAPSVIRTGERVHIVEPGDTLSSIAAEYEVGLPQLRAVNRNVDGGKLVVGRRLRIPAPKPAVRHIERIAPSSSTMEPQR